MAKSVRVKLSNKEVGVMLNAKGRYQGIAQFMDGIGDDIERRMLADPNMPDDVTTDRQKYVGHDRYRDTIGIPGSLEARYGIASRAVDG